MSQSILAVGQFPSVLKRAVREEFQELCSAQWGLRRAFPYLASLPGGRVCSRNVAGEVPLGMFLRGLGSTTVFNLGSQRGG